MREDRRSEPGLANGRVEAGRMQESIQALRSQSNPMWFVHPCCTNSALRRARRFPTKCPRSSSSLSPRSDRKGNPRFVHPGCTNSGLSRTRGNLPKAFACRRVPRSCHLLAIARALPAPTIFAFYSPNVKLLFVRSDYICGRLAFPLFGPPGAAWSRSATP